MVVCLGEDRWVNYDGKRRGGERWRRWKEAGWTSNVGRGRDRVWDVQPRLVYNYFGGLGWKEFGFWKVCNLGPKI